MLADLRFALRSLRRAPAFALATVLTLALGIGAVTTLFTAVRGVLLRPLPYPRPERIVQINEISPKGDTSNNVSDPNFRDWRRDLRSFRAVAAYAGWPAVVLGGAEAARVPTAAVSRDFFAVTGVPPVLGRTFVPEEQQLGAAPAVVVGEGFWRRTLGASPDLGRLTLMIDGTRYRVVGVMPASFDFPAGTALWTARERAVPDEQARDAGNWRVVARLADGVPLAAARQETGRLTRALKRQFGSDMFAADAAVTPLRDRIVGRTRVPLLLLLAAAGVLLLVAAANVATLLFARAEARRREVGVRVAVGATAGRLARQFLTESALLAAAGAVLGVVAAVLASRLLGTVGDAVAIPRVDDVRVDAAVLAFALGLAGAVSAVLGAAVAVRATAAARGRESASLLTGERAGTAGHGGARARSALVAFQVALTAVLLVGAGLLARSFVRLIAVDPGFRTTDAVVASLTFPGVAEEDTAADVRRRQTADAIVARLRALPGVSAAGGVNNLPVGGQNGADGTFLVLARPDEVKSLDDYVRLSKDPSRSGHADYRRATDGYFEAMRIPVLRGRIFGARDGASAPPVAVISASVARTRFAGHDPLGKLIEFGNMDGDVRPFTVVGVVGDVREWGLDADPSPTVYALVRQRPSASALTVVLAGGPGFDAAATVATVRRVLRDIAPALPARVMRIDDVFARSVAARRYALLLAGAFAVAALALAVTGLYGVVAYVAAQRRRELGVRVALGARGADVRRLMLGRGLAPAALGLAAGLAAALALGRLLASQLYEVRPADPATYAAVALALGVGALAAAWGPARGAARADPVDALRAE
ncbi:hypothetical protein tb265_41700 [Gemmatimonadetes bacterium T265]|nr:hypothetical protein tb265_41700 [Gemmatimonadetes bacterium T265]